MRHLALKQRVFVMLEAAGLEARPCPTNRAIADMLGIAAVMRGGMILQQLHDDGLIRLRRESPYRWAEAADGSWRTERSILPRAGEGNRAAPVPARRCLRCRDTFTPEHRGRFCCDGCWATNRGEAMA